MIWIKIYLANDVGDKNPPQKKLSARKFRLHHPAGQHKYISKLRHITRKHNLLPRIRALDNHQNFTPTPEAINEYEETD